MTEQGGIFMHELRAYLKNPQKPIVSLMQALNLRADPNGVCNGVAVMSALYFLKGKQNYIADILILLNRVVIHYIYK